MTDSDLGWVRDLSLARTRTAVYEAIIDGALSRLPTDRAEFLEVENGRLVVRACIPAAPEQSGRRYPLWTGVIGGAFTSKTSHVIDDYHDTRGATESLSADEDALAGHHSVCMAPVDDHGLLVVWARPRGAFDSSDEAVLTRLAEIAHVVLNRLEHVSTSVHADGGGNRSHIDAEEQLVEIGDILSHDLVSPLNVVQGSLEMARETGDDAHFERAESALQRVNDFVDQAVLLARTGELIANIGPVEIAETATEVWGDIGPTEADLIIEDSAPIETSERALRQIFQNLITNAIEHADSTVTVRIGLIDGGFYVEDDGPGIPENHREQVFERGYSTADGNTGLGLSIVKKIAEAHGWTISVHESAGGGARFAFSGVAFY